MSDVPTEKRPSLNEKYWSMFWSYRSITDLSDVFLKNLIIQAHNQGVKLRGDAAFFLLLNFDQMVLRVESISLSAQQPTGYPLQPSPENIQKAFWRIIEGVREQQTDEFGHSAHEIMKSIDGAWAELVIYLAWE